MKKYEITKEQILQLSKMNCVIEEHIKEWFPEAFKTVLEVGKWYKYNAHGLSFFYVTKISFFYVTKIEGKKVFAYGFNYKGVWRYDSEWFEIDNYIPEILEIATESEVFEALKNEAVRRGFVGNYFESVELKDITYCCNSYFTFNHGILYSNGSSIFCRGKWAEILETISKQDAEKLLNKKII